MDTNITERKPHNDDVLTWPDGSWCVRQDIGEYPHMSATDADCTVLFFETNEWYEFWRKEVGE